MAIPSFMFDAQAGQTPGSIESRRKIAQTIAAGLFGRAPQNLGEGLNSIGDALLFAKMNNDASTAEKAGLSGVPQMFGGTGANPTSAAIASMITGQPAGAPSGAAAGPVVPNDDNALPGQVGMDLRLADRSQDFMQDFPNTTMSSGVRSTADQARLYADRANNSNPVARPGTSNHERGMAVDIAGMTPDQRAILPQYGLSQPVPRDPPHVELAPNTQYAQATPQTMNDGAELPANAQPTQGALPTAQAVQTASQPAQRFLFPQASNEMLQKAYVNPFTPKESKAAILKEMEMRAAAAQKAGAVTQETDANGNVWNIDRNTGKREVALKADSDTSDMKNYGFYAKQERDAGRLPLPFNDWQLSLKKAGTATTTINNTVNPILKGVGDRFNEDMDVARASIPQINGIFEARKALDQGAITGAGADQKLFLGKAANLFGLGGEAAANTETLRSAVGNSVLAKAKTLGANPSNADREYIEKIMGGSINLEETSMRRLLDIQEKWARDAIKRANVNGQKILAAQPEELKNISPLLTVTEPGSYDDFLKSNPIQQQRPAGAVRRYNPQTGKIE